MGSPVLGYWVHSAGLQEEAHSLHVSWKTQRRQKYKAMKNSVSSLRSGFEFWCYKTLKALGKDVFYPLQLRHGGLFASHSPFAPCSSTTVRAYTQSNRTECDIRVILLEITAFEQRDILPGPWPRSERWWSSSRPFLKVGWRLVNWTNSQ